MSMIRTRWAAVGAAVAVTLGAGGLSMAQAAISTGEKPVYVSLDAPCRVIDTRESTKIGAGDDADLDVQITGENGACTGPLAIPADAVGVSTNVTVIQPSDSASGRSYFTVYPTGATRPVTSNLNFVNGQAPTPNKVDVGIGAGGQITIYNNEGSAHAAVDIFGYYIDHNHDDRYYTKDEVDAALGTATGGLDFYTTTEVDAALATKANAADVYTKAEVDAAIQAAAAEVRSAMPFTVGASDGGSETVDQVGESILSVSVTAPVAGQVAVQTSALPINTTAGVQVRCSINDTASESVIYEQRWESPGTNGDQGSLSGTRVFQIAAGATATYHLFCRRLDGTGQVTIYDHAMSATFTPAPTP